MQQEKQERQALARPLQRTSWVLMSFLAVCAVSPGASVTTNT